MSYDKTIWKSKDIITREKMQKIEDQLEALSEQGTSGSGSGTSDYLELENKPQINGVTLTGNKSLTDLGAAATSDVAAKYTKPGTGIPASDLSSTVQASLQKADTALQGENLTSVVNNYIETNFSNPSSPPLDRTLSTSSSAAPADMVGELKSAIGEVTEEESSEETIQVTVPLDLSNIREGQRTADQVGQEMGLNSSSVTNAIIRAFLCEANKTYRLTITNGTTPALIADRATIVITTPVTSGGIITWVKRSTNSANAQDVVEFTPDVSGYVFFNLDKNFQSITVTATETQIVTEETAIDKKARNAVERVSKYVLNGQIEKTLTWESGSFDASLVDASGAGYRSNVITGVKGCAVCIKVDPSYSFVYGDGKNALMTVYGIYVIHPETDTIRLGLSDTPENVGFEMRIYKERGHKGPYDVIVAANDSSDEDKATADIVCDGLNDELDLQFAVNWNFWRRQRTIYSDRCNVLLLTGTYNIDSFTQQYSADGQLMRNRYGVVFGNHPYNNYQNYKYRVSLEGCYETEHDQSASSVLINVTDTALAALSSELNNTVFGLALKADGTTGSFTSNGISMIVKNLMIYTRGVANKIIAIDAYQAGNVVVKDCDIWATSSSAYLPSATIETAPEGSIGIRAGRGSCHGVRQRIEGCRINGFREGIAICGEHFVVQDCLELACRYGFTLNNYPTNGAVQHPNVFIGNSIEQCLNMAKFVESGNNATVVYIGGSVENKLTQDSPAVPMKPIEIAQNTQFRGRIESDGLASPYNQSFFYEGYGSTFEQTIYPFWQA